MALFGWSGSSFTLLQSHNHCSIPKPAVSKTLIPVPTIVNRRIHSVSVSSASPGLRYPCLRCCSAADESSLTRIFIKGGFFSSPEPLARSLLTHFLSHFTLKKSEKFCLVVSVNCRRTTTIHLWGKFEEGIFTVWGSQQRFRSILFEYLIQHWTNA